MAQQEALPWTILAELSYLRRLQKYQKRKSDYIEHRLHWLETSCEARNRIIQGAKDLQYELTDSIQSGDRNKFSLLFNTFHTLKQACDEWDTQSPVSENLSNHPPDYRGGSFMDGVSPDAREALLTFLSRVTSDPGFLLDRLLGLPDCIFASLSRPYSTSASAHTRSGNQFGRPSDKTEYENLRKFLDFSRSDVLGLLLNLVPTSDDIQEGLLPSAWGVICAGLLAHQKPGSDKFVVTVLNAHLDQLDKTACHYLENWLLETLRDGNFILFQADRRSSRNKSQPSSTYPNDDPRAVDDFFSAAVEKLLLILKDNELTRVIPSRVLDLGKSIVARLDPSSQQQLAAPYFLCTRWLFASYLSTLITSPEVSGTSCSCAKLDTHLYTESWHAALAPCFLDCQAANIIRTGTSCTTDNGRGSLFMVRQAYHLCTSILCDTGNKRPPSCQILSWKSKVLLAFSGSVRLGPNLSQMAKYWAQISRIPAMITRDISRCARQRF